MYAFSNENFVPRLNLFKLAKISLLPHSRSKMKIFINSFRKRLFHLLDFLLLIPPTNSIILVFSAQMLYGTNFSNAVHIKDNNRVATTEICKKCQQLGFEELSEFMKDHPLQGAYFNTVLHIYAQLLTEWWYTSTTNEDNTAISGTYHNGQERFTIAEEVVRRVLSIQQRIDFFLHLSRDQACTKAFPLVGQKVV